ncbi:unnamed protein product [Colias eurytheme]|nr:unnamed protein product [Colias eurytheme]
MESSGAPTPRPASATVRRGREGTAQLRELALRRDSERTCCLRSNSESAKQNTTIRTTRSKVVSVLNPFLKPAGNVMSLTARVIFT